MPGAGPQPHPMATLPGYLLVDGLGLCTVLIPCLGPQTRGPQAIQRMCVLWNRQESLPAVRRPGPCSRGGGGLPQRPVVAGTWHVSCCWPAAPGQTSPVGRWSPTEGQGAGEFPAVPSASASLGQDSG